MTSRGAHLFDDVIVVCLVAVNLRFIFSILYWAQNTLLAGESNTIFINVNKSNNILNIFNCWGLMTQSAKALKLLCAHSKQLPKCPSSPSLHKRPCMDSYHCIIVAINTQTLH